MVMRLACLLLNHYLEEQATNASDMRWLSQSFLPHLRANAVAGKEVELNALVWETALGMINDLPLRCEVAIPLKGWMTLLYSGTLLGERL